MKKSQEIKTSEYLNTFLRFVREVRSEYKLAFDRVGELDKATQDIMHQLELGDCKERGKFATKLARIRKERRQYKDFVDILSPLNRYFTEDTQWKHSEKMLTEVLGQVRKQENYVQNQRAYRPRCLDNLTIHIIEETDE